MEIFLLVVVLGSGLSLCIYGIKKQNRFFKYLLFFAIAMMLLSDFLDNM